MLTTRVQAEEKTKALGGSVGDLVWEDANKNGIQDVGEQGIEGITIELYSADGSKVGEQKTNQNGFYQFNALQEGDYFAHILIPHDQYKMVSTKRFGWDGWTNYFHIKGDGDNKLDADVGLLSQKGRIGATIWEDANKNGKRDEGEPGISHVTLELYDIDGKKIKTAITDEKGYYQFTDIPNGYYYVKLIVSKEYDFLGSPNFGKDQLSNYILVEGNTNEDMNAGFIKKQKEIPVESIKVEPSKIDTTEGENGTLKASVQPENATNKTLTYTSKDSNIVTIDKDGNWKALKAGVTTITVVAANGENAEITVTVKEKVNEVLPTALTITPTEDTYKGIGDSLHVQATVLPANVTNKTVTYTSSNTNVATIDSSGNIYVRGKGKALITVRTSNNLSKSFYVYGAEFNGMRQVSVKHSGKNLAINNGANTTTLGTPSNHLVQKSSSSNNDQKWEFQSADGKYYKIRNKGTGQYITATGTQIETGTQILVKAENNSNDQLWKIIPIQGSYVIKSVSRGTIMDVAYARQDSGAIVHLFTGWEPRWDNELFYINRA
ncbi:hypothetical protein BLD50_00345 [Bacillus cereus]|nr:hypothetical protein BLD50_00345 [Bacillus cereus]